MDAIERQVRLPREARPLADYARYYASAANGEIVGIYIVPAGDIAPSEKCEEVAADMTSRPVACPRLDRPLTRPKAGERLWLDDQGKLPVVFDGGCSVVNVRYNPTTKRVEETFCNGVA